MNSPEWDERVAGGDLEATALNDGLARDVRLLQTLPPEAFAVDYAAIRAAARKGAVQRSRRPKVLAVLAVALAAAVLLTLKLPLYRRPPAPVAEVVAKVSAQPPALEVARAVPAVSSAFPKVHPRRPRNLQPDLDRKFADFLRAHYELQHPAPPPSSEIATGNPNVTILLLQESKGDANE